MDGTLTLANWSDVLMFSAAAVYMIAFVFYAWDLVKAGTSNKDQSLEATAASPQKKLSTVAVGGGSPAGNGDQTPEAPIDRASSGAGSITVDSTTLPRKLAKIAFSLTVVGFLMHTGGVLFRAIAAERVPWGNMYEFATTGAWVVVGVFIAVSLRRDIRYLGSFVIGIAVLMLCFATIGFYVPVGSLVPALQSYWIVIHVSVAVLASALFAISCGLSVLQLLQSRRAALLAEGKPSKMAFLRIVPDAAELERFAYRINAISFIFWTFTLIAGAIWADKAWGRYWGWDPKEVWTLIIWIVYAGYLHARATRGWDGTRAAWLSIAGFACIVFNFTFVNLYSNGLHSYAGV